MTSIHDFKNFNKLEPTVPNDQDDPPRFGQPIETAKDALILELRRFFDRNDISSNRLKEIPTIRKYDVSTVSGEGSLETAVKLIQKFPDINENLPLVAVLSSTARNLPLGISGQYVAPVKYRTKITSSIPETFAIEANQTLIYKTTTATKEEHTSTTIFRSSRFTDISQATAQEIVDEINFQALYARAYVSENNEIELAFGGPMTHRVIGDIEIIGGTAAAALGFTPGQKAEYKNDVTYHRYNQATYIDIAIEIAAEDFNIRTELTDLVWSFITFYMDSRDYTFFGRSTFNPAISNETYQVIIKPDPSMAGEQEVPRPGDEVDKVFVNRINFPVTIIQYIDRAVLVPGTTTPLYIDAENIQPDPTIPPKS